MTRTSRAAPWVIGAVSLIASANASAASYAVSTDGITGFTLGMPSSAWFGGFTLSGDIAVSLGTLTGGDVNISVQDAPAACIGTYCSSLNNSFNSHGAGPTPGYAYGDAQILSTNIRGGTGAASSIGEVTAYNGLGAAAGANAMEAAFTLVSPASLSFSFLATPYLSTQPGAGALAASGDIGMMITIWRNGNKVFQWMPDGQSGGIFSGTETLDPFSLNLGISGNTTYSPGTELFGASTSVLTAGSYTMNINMSNSVHVAAVPVPAALPLFGSGVVALAALIRRTRTQARAGVRLGHGVARPGG